MRKGELFEDSGVGKAGTDQDSRPPVAARGALIPDAPKGELSRDSGHSQRCAK